MKILKTLWAVCFIISIAQAQETGQSVEPPRIADEALETEIKNPVYPKGKGPVVLIDEAHNNFHTATGTYKPFASLLERDGYVIKRGKTKIIEEALEPCRVLVISDAMPLEDKSSPFCEQEIKVIHDWVKNGGALLLITDHLPDPPAVETLAAAFGVELNNGYVLNGYPDGPEKPLLFKRSDGALKSHPITDGPTPESKVDTIATFSGCAFKAHDRFEPLLVFGPGNKSWMPDKPYDIRPDTPTVDVEGWFQGAAARFGKGRVAVFGEAAMFTAQLFGKERARVGMNHPMAKENARFLRNLMHWLSATD